MIWKRFLNKNKKKSYKEKMSIIIENINTIEKRNKVYTKRLGTIYKVIQPDYFSETDISMDDLIYV